MHVWLTKLNESNNSYITASKDQLYIYITELITFMIIMYTTVSSALFFAIVDVYIHRKMNIMGDYEECSHNIMQELAFIMTVLVFACVRLCVHKLLQSTLT